jgi:hypothetical protein
MAKKLPSVSNLCHKAELTDDEIQAAMDAHLKDEVAEPFVLSSDHRIDVAKAVKMRSQAKKLLADKDTMPGLRRAMVMTAVIMGFPV